MFLANLVLCCSSEGNFPDIAACGSFHEFLVDLHQQYGSIVSFWWGPQVAVSIASPELFRDHSKVFDRPRKAVFFTSTYYVTLSLMYTDGGIIVRLVILLFFCTFLNHWFRWESITNFTDVHLILSLMKQQVWNTCTTVFRRDNFFT